MERNPCLHKKLIPVTLSNSDQIHSPHIDNLKMLQLPKVAHFYHIVPGLTKYSLIPVVKLYKTGYEIEYTKYEIGVENQVHRQVLTSR